MGKLKFTLVNIWFWVAMILVCFLTENLAHLTPNPKAGFDYPTLFLLTFACLASLFMFYFINHKNNKMKIDWVLLPAFIIVGSVFTLSIWLNKGGEYPFANGSGSFEVIISNHDKIKATITLWVFLIFSYAMFFSLHINSPFSKKIRFLALVGVGAALISLVYSLITEKDVYISIFKGTVDPGASIDSFYGNKNYYGGVLFIGFLSCIIANYYKPRFYTFLLAVIFPLGILASASMLPAIISIVAMLIYLFEEVIRYSIKKKWLYSFFATFSIICVLALVILFFYGVTHMWDGFIGLDAYLTEMFQKKNFATFSGRIDIWKSVFPYCFDNFTHLFLGHGFMISEKTILGITGAMHNNNLPGVRTAHNGYLQVLFEYGLFGVLIHLILVSYFIYCCIRLLLEKRFHFVFIYLFVGICCAAYNYCESSSYFDAGVKEIFMTCLFVMPVIRDAKFINHYKKVEEIKNSEVSDKELDHISLGKVLSVAIMSVIVITGTMFMSPISYNSNWLRYLLLNIIIGSSIALIFIPYLIALYYKNSDKLFFILRFAFNFILMGLAVSFCFIFFNRDPKLKSLIPYLIPSIIAGMLLLEVFFYSLIKRGSIKQWANITFVGGFYINKIAILGGLLFGAIPYLVMENLGYMNMFIYVLVPFISFIGYYALLYFFPSKQGKEVFNNLNNTMINYQKELVIKGEKYYG